MKLNGLLAVLITGLALSGTTGAQDQEKAGDLFKTLDANNDGRLTAGEVSEDQKRFFERLLRVGDSDEDGVLTRAEFGKATAQNSDTPAPSDQRPGAGQPVRRPGQPGSDRARNPQEMFRRMDRNQDGKLALDEIPEPIRSRMKPLFERVGKDVITVDDLKTLAPRNSDRRPADANRPDGRRPADSARPGQPSRPEDTQRRGPAFFRELDQNQDGSLSREELERAATLLAKLDRNRNGKLEFNELFGFAGSGASGRPAPRPDRPTAGRPGDRPEPGRRPRRPEGERPPQNDRSESRSSARPDAGGTALTRLQQNFSRIDKDNDGFLSRDEAPDKLKENFDRVDRNGDGKVSVDEIRSLYERSRRD